MGVLSITKTESVQEIPQESEKDVSFWTKMKLIPLGILMVIIGFILRNIDIFVLNLDVFWTNIVLCKVLSLVILVSLFWVYRRKEIGPVLGLSRDNLSGHIVIGLIIGIGMIVGSMWVSAVLYQMFVDPSLSIQFVTILGPELIVYTFAFFAINAVYEETLFRGLLQNGFRERYGPAIGILISSIIFGVWHIVWPIQTFFETGIFPVREAMVKVVFSGVLGVVFGIYYEKFAGRKALTGTIVAHTFINYLNEGFKVIIGTVEPGPDLSFIDSLHMTIGLSITLAMFAVMILFFWKFKVADVSNSLSKIYEGLKKRIPIRLVK